jgi:hypothetical protein
MEIKQVIEETIVQWRMTREEAGVYKLACLYDREFRRLFCGTGVEQNSFKRNTISFRNDPRKSFLFRHCWKLRRETRGLLESHQFRQYIVANLTIIKLNDGYVEPNLICGDKAWIRWKLYERWFKQKEAEKACLPPPPSVSTIDPKIVKEIDTTKKFLFERCEGEVTEEKLQKFFDDGIMRFWILTGKVSRYYLILSPFANKICDMEEFAEQCSFDPVLFREKISNEVKEYFKHEYKHEF